MVRLTDGLNMTIVVDWDVKQQNKQTTDVGAGSSQCSISIVPHRMIAH